MRKAFGCAALSCALSLASAKALKWSDQGPRWVPAQPTQLGFMPALGMSPMPTSPPQVQKERGVLEARHTDDNTCGYVSGISTASLYCDATAHCIYNSVNSHIGCCDDTSSGCPVWTACYDSTDSASYSTNNGFTLWCGNSKYPHCTTHLYKDARWTGYTLLGCGVAAGTGSIYFTSVEADGSSSARSSASTTSDSSSSSSSSAAPTSSSSASSSSTTPTPTPTPAPSSGSSTPVGPIVGGVVGGLGAIALIVLGIWALVRQNNKQKKKNADAAAAAAAAAAAGGAHQQQPPPTGGGPPMGQVAPQGYYGAGAAAPGYDPRGSIAKPPGVTTAAYAPSTAYDQSTVTGSSPPGSPPPPSAYHNYDAHQGTPSPPPPGQFGQFGQQQQQQYGQQQGYDHTQQQFGSVSPGTTVSPATQAGGFQPQPQHQHSQHFQPQGYTAELPAGRGDGELRELAG